MQRREQLDQPLLRTRVEPVVGSSRISTSGLIDSAAAKGDLLLLAAAQAVGRPLGERAEIEHAQRVFDAAEDLVVGQVEMQRSEGDLVAHGRVEELGVGVLEHHADTPPKALRYRFVCRAPPLTRSPKASTSPCVGSSSPAKTLSRVDLPEPLAPRMREALAGVDLQIDAGERLDAGRVLIADAVQPKDGRHRAPAVKANQTRAPSPAATPAAQTMSSGRSRQVSSVRVSPR